jgi:hypothetical protein
MVLALALCAGCATKATVPPVPARIPVSSAHHAADVLIQGMSYTRASSREVAGWCWNDKATGRLAQVATAHVGDYEGVGVTLPADAGGRRYVSCSWHTHPWGSHVVPGPSKQDLRNSMRGAVSGISHFVLDQQGVWQYAQGRVIEMCPWNSAGNGIDAARCRS